MKICRISIRLGTAQCELNHELPNPTACISNCSSALSIDTEFSKSPALGETVLKAPH